MRKNIVKVLSTALISLSLCSVPASAGTWDKQYKDRKYGQKFDWYYKDDYGHYVNGWQYIDGEWYWFDMGNVLFQGGWFNEGTGWYYANADGSMAHDCYKSGVWIDSNGHSSYYPEGRGRAY